MAAPGWYGKLPFLGDFAGRRLPTSFVSTWDDWLQNVIYGSRALLDDTWLPRYLTSPIWHFFLPPGICGNHAWVGLLMSSVDRANRHFPFTIAQAFDAHSLRTLPCSAIADWLTNVEQIAVSMLDLDGSIDLLEQRLSAQSAPAENLNSDDTLPRVASDLASYIEASLTVAAADLVPLLAAAAQQSAAAPDSRLSLWWTPGDEYNPGIACAWRGLPSAERYAAMLSASVPEVP